LRDLPTELGLALIDLERLLAIDLERLFAVLLALAQVGLELID
jgi:hypothetical protein